MIIGITGRVGVGKSTAVKAIASAFTVEILDLDQLGHDVLREETVRKKLVMCFGSDILNSEGEVLREILSKKVFSSLSAIKKCNRIVHPVMKEKSITLIRAMSGRLLLIVGALIEEIGLRPFCDKIIVIDAEDMLIKQAIGAKFRIAQFQKSRGDYQKIGDIMIKNPYTSDFQKACQTAFQTLLSLPSHYPDV